MTFTTFVAKEMYEIDLGRQVMSSLCETSHSWGVFTLPRHDFSYHFVNVFAVIVKKKSNKLFVRIL